VLKAWVESLTYVLLQALWNKISHWYNLFLDMKFLTALLALLVICKSVSTWRVTLFYYHSNLFIDSKTSPAYGYQHAKLAIDGNRGRGRVRTTWLEIIEWLVQHRKVQHRKVNLWLLVCKGNGLRWLRMFNEKQCIIPYVTQLQCDTVYIKTLHLHTYDNQLSNRMTWFQRFQVNVSQLNISHHGSTVSAH